MTKKTVVFLVGVVVFAFVSITVFATADTGQTLTNDTSIANAEACSQDCSKDCEKDCDKEDCDKEACGSGGDMGCGGGMGGGMGCGRGGGMGHGRGMCGGDN